MFDSISSINLPVHNSSMPTYINKISLGFTLSMILLLGGSKLSGQKIPGFWYEDNNMNTAGGFPPDFTEMFTDPGKWEKLRDTISVYMVRGNTLNNIINQEGESFISDHFAQVLNGSNLTLAIDNPPSTSAWPSFYKLLTDNGITVSHVALQSVLSKPRDNVSPQYDPELENRIQELKNDIKTYSETAPDVKYGIIDARPTKGWEYRNAYQRTQDALRSVSLDLDFIILDCPYSYPSQGINIDWSTLKEVEVFVMDNLNVEYGLVFTDNQGGMQNDEAFYDRVMAYASTYDKTKSIPDYLVLMSWFLHPSKALPEDAPDGLYPMTKVGLELFHYLGGYYSPSGVSESMIRSDNKPLVWYRDSQLYLDFDRPVQSVSVYNIAGQKVYACLGNDIKILFTGFMDPGLYLVHMRVEGGSFCSKLIVNDP